MDEASIGKADCVVVGAGITGLVIAERLSTVYRKNVVVVEKRPFIGGNAYTYIDVESRIECHKYGTHIFHTNNKRVWDYITMFGEFNTYRHRVFSRYGSRLYPIPINLATANMFFGANFTPSNMDWEKALPALKDAFYGGYSKKHWGVPLEQLPAKIVERLPVYRDYSMEYFTDQWQGVPLKGYTSLFRAMLNEKITVMLGADFFSLCALISDSTPIVYTGALDRYFDYVYGQLPWRAIRLEFEILNIDDYQGIATINYADEHIPYTRIHEFKHLHPESRELSKGKTVIAREFAEAINGNNEPAYPVSEDGELAQRYRELALLERGSNDVFFCGRLGQYRYLDMDDAVAAALDIADTIFT